MTDNIDHLLATAIFDSENTARLQEHPEELDEYLRRAHVLRHHMKVIGLSAMPLAQIRSQAIEEAAVVAEKMDAACRPLADENSAACHAADAALDIAEAIRALAEKP